MLKKIKKHIKKSISRLKMQVNFVVLSGKYRCVISRLQKQLGKLPINVGFIGYADGASCDVFTRLYRVFKKDPRFKCEVVVLPYSHDSKEMMMQKHQRAVDYLRGLDIEPLPGYDEEKDEYVDYHERFDITFFENEYDWVEPIFKVENFRNSLSFVIPYGQYLADNIHHHLHHKMMSEVFDVFPTSVPVRDMMVRYSDINGLNIHKEYLGNPKTDMFFDKELPFVDVWKKAKPGQKRIIWAPHHTWAPYSNFHTYADFFLQFAAEYKDTVCLAIKPHPALKDSLRDVDGWSEDEINAYFSKWSNGENTDLFEGAWFDLFKSSDAMVLDSLGFMLEYSLAGRPACVIYRVDEHGNRVMKFSECGEELYEHLYHAKSQSEIKEFIQMILDSKDTEKQNREAYLQANYLPPYGRSGAQNIYEYIISVIQVSK